MRKRKVHYFLSQYWYLIILVFMTLLNVLYRILKNGIGFSDYYWIWKEHFCAVHGISIGETFKNHLYIQEINNSLSSIATIPWGRMVGNLFCPGFLPYETARIYGIVLYTVTFIVMLYCVANMLQEYFVDFSFREAIYLTVFCIFLPVYWSDAIVSWNIGVFLTMLMIISIYLINKNELFAGILLGIAMCKPQIAGIFYISLLIKRKWKVIIASGVVVFISWGIYLVMCGENPLFQLLELVYEADEKGQTVFWYGIFDFVSNYTEVKSIAIIFSALFGVCYTAILSIAVNKSQYRENMILYYSIPALASTIWCYKSFSDMIILFLPSICMIAFVWNNKNVWKEILIAISLGLINDKVVRITFKLVGFRSNLAMSLDSFFRMLIFMFFVIVVCSRKQFERDVINIEDNCEQSISCI